MVQGLNVNSNGMGSISRVGMTNNGRVIYSVVEPNGQVAGHLTVSQKDCDTFERSYRSIIATAPSVQRYAETTTPEKQEKNKKRARWITGISAVIGGGVPIWFTRNFNFKGATWAQAGITLLGTIAGFIGGSAIASATTVPKELKQFASAMRDLQKIDIEPLQ